jgi:hypothetical protein
MRLLGVVVTGLVLGLALGSGAEAAWPSGASPPVPAGVPPALAVLHAWDSQRGAAYSRGDPRALARLYVPGSTAAAADVAIIRAYAARGLRVVGLTEQVFSARVDVLEPDRVRLHLVDRVAGAVVGLGRCWPLPHDRARARTVVLLRSAGRWRVLRVAQR